jgi:Tol biopolymer transport system component
VLLLWLIGVAIRPVRFAVQWRAVRRLCRSAAHPPAAFACDLFAQEADRMLVRRLPRLRVSPGTQVPLMAGIWRPMILLPEGADAAFDVGEMRLMLAHELAHVKRHDLAWNWLPTIVDWLFFFHPLVWLMTCGWSESQEAACDELLIQRRVAAPVEYGRLLVKLAALRPRQPHPQLVAAGVLGMYRDLEKRILAMTRVKPMSFHRLALTLAILLLVAAPGIVPWQLVARGEQRTLVAAETPAADAQALPGKIYADINLQTKTPAGETEKYRGVIVIDPNTGAWQKLGDLGNGLRVSPEGERIASTQRKPSQTPRQKQRGSEPFVADLKTLAAVKVADSGGQPIWSPDGKELLYHVGTMEKETGWRGATWLIDLATRQTRKLPIPEEDEVDDWTGPGDWMVTVSDRHPPFGRGYQLYVMHPDGTGQRRITEGNGLNCYPRFRPDGKQIVYNHQGGGFDSLWVVDIDGGNRRKILSSDDNGHNAPSGAHWSPDGKWLAVSLFDWQIVEADPANPGKKRRRMGGLPPNARIEIIAADGTHERQLKLEGVSQIEWLNSVDWH